MRHEISRERLRTAREDHDYYSFVRDLGTGLDKIGGWECADSVVRGEGKTRLLVRRRGVSCGMNQGDFGELRTICCLILLEKIGGQGNAEYMYMLFEAVLALLG